MHSSSAEAAVVEEAVVDSPAAERVTRPALDQVVLLVHRTEAVSRPPARARNQEYTEAAHTIPVEHRLPTGRALLRQVE